MDAFKGILYSAFVAFAIAVVLGPVVIVVLRKLKLGQSVRGEGPKSHLKKNGIPTMGGIIFLTAAAIAAVSAGKVDFTMMVLLLCTMGFAIIGFIDDALKIRRRNSQGLTVGQKLAGQTAVSIVFVIAVISKIPGTEFMLPFLNGSVDLKWAYIPVTVFFIVATVNGVNLTDGLDGLASSVTVFVGVFLCVAAIIMGDGGMDGVVSSNGSEVINGRNVGIFCGALCGGLGGFLVYNSHPTKIIMGDTGSLALGGAIASAAVILKLPVFLALAGFIYVLEIISVILQVVTYRLTGKRIFRMAPVHHHLELYGWGENKIVTFFSLITAILCIVSIAALG